MARRRHKRAHRNPKAFKLFGMGLPMLALLGVGGFVIWKYMLNKPAGTVTALLNPQHLQQVHPEGPRSPD